MSHRGPSKVNFMVTDFVPDPCEEALRRPDRELGRPAGTESTETSIFISRH